MNLQTGAVLPGWGMGSGNTVGSGQGLPDQPSGGVPASGVTASRCPGARPSTRPPRSTATTRSTSGPATRPHRSTAAITPTTRTGRRPNARSLPTRPPTTPPTAASRRRSRSPRGSLVEGGSLGQMTYGARQRQRRAGGGLAAVLRRQRVLHRGRGRSLRHGLGRLRRRRCLLAGVRSRHATTTDGGHVRIYNDHGGLICSADTDEEVDSSPAVGPILAGGAYGIATGTGTYLPGRQRREHGEGLRHQVQPGVERTLTAPRAGSPALADVQGNGQLAVVEGTLRRRTVYALNASTGAPLAHPGLGRSSRLGDDGRLHRQGYQDVIVPTTRASWSSTGQTGLQVADVDDGSSNGGVPGGRRYGFQNAPPSPPTPAETSASPWRATSVSAAATCRASSSTSRWRAPSRPMADAAGGWPPVPPRRRLDRFRRGRRRPGTCNVPPPAQNGYLTVASDGGILAFGQDFCGSTGSTALNKPVVGMAAVPGQGGIGWWRPTADLLVRQRRLLRLHRVAHANRPVVGMAATPDGGGYWLVASDGGIFATATPSSTAPPPRSPDRTSSAWRRRPTVGGTGR